MIYGSVCSGIEAASVAWGPLGWTPRFFAEIEPFPSAVLAHRFPGVPNLGDFTKIGEEHGPVKLLVGGTPCQSFSVAGKRLGMDDPRGNLSLEYLALARRLRPRWLVFENVPGLLSSDEGRDFGVFLGAMGELGYGFAYRILDAQHFGVPQRRRRVFVVGYSGAWGPAAAVLLERTCLLRNPPASGEEGEGVAGCLEARVATGGHDPGASGAASGHLVPSLMGSGTGMERPAGLPAEADYLVGPYWDGGEISATLDAAGLQMMPDKGRFPCVVTPPLKAEGADASEDGTGRGTPLVVDMQGGKGQARVSSNVSPGLGADSQIHAILPVERGNQGAGGNVGHGKPVAFGGPVETTGHQGDTVVGEGDVFPCLPSQGGNNAGGPGTLLQAMMKVRRLTPRECERLQGFPDDWTLVPYRGKPAADGPRYRAIGNSMAIPVMHWIGERITMVEKILEGSA